MVPTKIRLTKEDRKLTSIIAGDILIFSDREEKIKIVDRWEGKLYNQRIRGDVEEKVLYRLNKNRNGDYVINQDSVGIVYQTKKLGGK